MGYIADPVRGMRLTPNQDENSDKPALNGRKGNMPAAPRRFAARPVANTHAQISEGREGSVGRNHHFLIPERIVRPRARRRSVATGYRRC
ncbi:hypothetical protein GCM10007977_079240 [Dactylosporangium sucinum]|uniref:Uncharacterized protein n=1 Tax=Dactylosporangium sucinum TaxID=1424081 RepID=A0A917X4R7_9ACTN|nr:hypothetical protein GCM10007977_079240 [Dactylosporangium sucinum]